MTMKSTGSDFAPAARPARHIVRVLENRYLSPRYYLLVLSRPVTLQQPGPGTFIHLLVPDGRRFFLRRPFSVMDCDDKTISLIVVEKGVGTQIMRKLPPGRNVDLIGPLGSTFPRMPGKRVLALGGGVGLAPLYYYWLRRGPDDCASFRLLYGARNKEDLFIDNFDWNHDGVSFSSDDGSYGFAGTVVDFAQTEIERSPADVIFSCGPNPMLKAAANFARQCGLPHFVSLENRMACALGACRSCVVLTRSGDAVRYRTVCSDGPVFDAEELVWKELPEA
jgi:dihydroorotate dehydrogenase electron transfer subunit